MRAAAAAAGENRAGGPPARRLLQADRVFEYVGDSGMTATGGVTRRRYIFFSPGSRVEVDPRDVESLLSIPALRQVGSGPLR